VLSAITSPQTVVHLLGGFAVTVGEAVVDVPASTHRLVALLALRRAAVDRSHASACLWLDKSEDRAFANLRCSLWRLRHCDVELVAATPSRLSLAPGVVVDATGLLDLARALVDEVQPVELDGLDVAELAAELAAELLPTWYDDFVELERERFRQMRLHALEALSRRLRRAGRHAQALDAALTAVAADSLRESAHRCVIEVHLAEGNPGEAVRQYRQLAMIMEQQLGIAPSRRTLDLVADRTERLRPVGPAYPSPAYPAPAPVQGPMPTQAFG
jgi:DNA-binding SARP family transcriptional activator